MVLHPGCYTTGNETAGLELVGDALAALFKSQPGQTMVLLEQTAGQGTSLGTTFEQLAAIIERVNGHPRVGVCLDTCHLFAAGYDLTTDAGYRDTFERFEAIIGFGRLRAFHLNDSKRPLGSRVDRHEHIGAGFLGVDRSAGS